MNKNPAARPMFIICTYNFVRITMAHQETAVELQKIETADIGQITNPCLNVLGKIYSLSDIAEKLKQLIECDFIQSIDESVKLDNIQATDVKTVYDVLDRLPKKKTIRRIGIYNTKPSDDRVTLQHGFQKKDSKITSVKITVKVGKLEPNTSFNICTNLVFIWPKSEPNFVIIPHVECDGDNDALIPAIVARDRSDKGLFFVSGTTKTGNVGKLIVTLKAYSATKMTSQLSLIDREQPNERLLKKKDSSDDCLVYNPQVNVVCDWISRALDDRTLQLDTFQSKTDPIVIYKRQTLKVRREPNQTVMWCTRKRECLNPNLVSLSGIWNDDHFVRPILATGSKYTANVFCFVFLQERNQLISEHAPINVFENGKWNGSVATIDDYGKIKKQYDSALANIDLIKLRFFAWNRATDAEREKIPFDEYLRISCCSPKTLTIEETLAYRNMTDETLCERFQLKYSTLNRLLWNMKTLVRLVFKNELLPNQLEMLKTSTGATDSIDADDVSKQLKRSHNIDNKEPNDETENIITKHIKLDEVKDDNNIVEISNDECTIDN